MTHDPSRKHFLGKLTGLAVVAGLAPRVLAKTPAVPAAQPARAVSLRPDARAVARRPGAA